MKKCWKCQSDLREEATRFCPRCGAALAPDTTASTDWQSRIDQENDYPNWAASFLWLLLGPVMILAFPFFLGSSIRRLKRHNNRRAAAPATTSPAFTGTEEGAAILNRLKFAAGNPRRKGVGPAFLLLLLVLGTGIVLFILPASAPWPFTYARTIDKMLEVHEAHYYLPVYNEAEYQSSWQNLSHNFFHYDRFSITSRSRASAQFSDYPVWNNQYDTYWSHRPYRYVCTTGGSRELYEVSSMEVVWRGTVRAGIFFYVLFGLLYLWLLFFGIRFWVLFTRHARAEALAAAFAKRDLAFHDRIVSSVQARSGLIKTIGILLAITQWQIVLFPIMTTVLFARHKAWERKSGISQALGLTAA